MAMQWIRISIFLPDTGIYRYLPYLSKKNSDYNFAQIFLFVPEELINYVGYRYLPNCTGTR